MYLQYVLFHTKVVRKGPAIGMWVKVHFFNEFCLCDISGCSYNQSSKVNCDS